MRPPSWEGLIVRSSAAQGTRGTGKEKSIGYYSHHDTMPIDNLSDWEYDPFGGEIVDGKITGKVISEKELVVGESGEIEADVNVGILSVSGKITGTIHVKEKLEIHPTGRVLGDLTLEKPNLVIHEGGVFEGNIDMNAGKKKDSREPAHKEAEIESIRRHSSTN